MIKVFLRKKISERIQYGHAWIYANEIANVTGPCKDGAIVHVFTSTGSFIGQGLYTKSANIAIRLYTNSNDEQIDTAFFIKKIEAAFHRKSAWIKEPIYRLIQGEQDGLSGLYISVINDIAVVQCSTLGMDLRYVQIQEALKVVGFKAGNIVKDDSHSLRRFEHLTISPSVLINQSISVNNATFSLETLAQWSFERKYICDFIAQHAANKVIVDLFAGYGNFTKIALANGATAAYAVELDKQFAPALEALRLSYPNHCKYIAENVFDFWKKQGNAIHPDLIIIDPPVFNISLGHPLQAYKELLLKALTHIKPSGIIIFGNSNFKIKAIEFESMIQSAFIDLKQTQAQYQLLPSTIDVQPHWLYEHTNAVKFYVITNICPH